MPFITQNPIIDLQDQQPSIYYMDDGVALAHVLDSPEGLVSANAGSFFTSRTGRSFLKTTDGGSTGWVEMGRVVAQNVAGAITSGTGLDPLQTITIPPGTLNADGKHLEVISHGAASGAAGNKRFLCRINGSQVMLDTGLVVMANAFWHFEMSFFRNTSTIVDARAIFRHSPFAATGTPTFFTFGFFGAGITPGNQFTIDFLAECANGADTVGQDSTIVTIP